MKLSLGGPAFAIAMIALFVALSGVAVASGIVPLARHAITAGTAANALKLGGKTPTQIKAGLRGVQGPVGVQGPAGPAGAKGDPGPAGAAGPQGVQGVPGPKGAVGAGLKIVGTVASVGALPATGVTGDAYLVGGSLYVWTGSAWTNAGPVQGPTGATGPTGAQGVQGQQGIQGIPGPAGTAAVSVHTQPYSLAANAQQDFPVNCAAGQKAVGGGFDSNGDVFNLDTRPTGPDDGWTTFLVNPDSSTDNGTVYAICLG